MDTKLKFLAWTLFLTVIAVVMLVTLVGILQGKPYIAVGTKVDNPRNYSAEPLVIQRENICLLLFYCLTNAVIVWAAIKNWRKLLSS